jgi:hypothetical protein
MDYALDQADLGLIDYNQIPVIGEARGPYVVEFWQAKQQIGRGGRNLDFGDHKRLVHGRIKQVAPTLYIGSVFREPMALHRGGDATKGINGLNICPFGGTAGAVEFDVAAFMAAIV